LIRPPPPKSKGSNTKIASMKLGSPSPIASYYA
jgi:hypothetical protein